MVVINLKLSQSSGNHQIVREKFYVLWVALSPYDNFIV